MLRVFLVALLVMSAGCKSEQLDITGPGDVSDDPIVEGVSYSRDIAPIFASSCAGSGCHVGQTTSGVQLSSHSALMGSVGQQYGGAIVRTGNAAGSPLVDKLEPSPQFGSRMPLGKSPLNSADIAQIRTWINAGAANN